MARDSDALKIEKWAANGDVQTPEDRGLTRDTGWPAGLFAAGRPATDPGSVQPAFPGAERPGVGVEHPWPLGMGCHSSLRPPGTGHGQRRQALPVGPRQHRPRPGDRCLRDLLAGLRGGGGRGAPRGLKASTEDRVPKANRVSKVSAASKVRKGWPAQPVPKGSPVRRSMWGRSQTDRPPGPPGGLTSPPTVLQGTEGAKPSTGTTGPLGS